MEEMKEKVKILGIEDSVKFLGQRNDINELYQAMDLLLFPSLYEGLGMVVVEAQISGLPCVVSTEIPKIAKVTKKITFVNLENKIKPWNEVIFKYLSNINRKNINFTDKIENYDIKKDVTKLEIKYINLSNGKEEKNEQN